jgi:hypothetical protein
MLFARAVRAVEARAMMVGTFERRGRDPGDVPLRASGVPEWPLLLPLEYDPASSDSSEAPRRADSIRVRPP